MQKFFSPVGCMRKNFGSKVFEVAEDEYKDLYALMKTT
jgi:hypothetical protein